MMEKINLKIVLGFVLLFAVLILLFNFFYYGTISLAGGATAKCKAIANDSLIRPGSSVKVRPGSYNITLSGKRSGSQSLKKLVVPFSNSRLACPENLTDEELVMGLSQDFKGYKLLEVQFLEKETWLVAYIGKGTFADGTKQVVASYTTSGWKIVLSENGLYPTVPQSVQTHIEEAAMNE